jgi:hypothetical protein
MLPQNITGYNRFICDTPYSPVTVLRILGYLGLKYVTYRTYGNLGLICVTYLGLKYITHQVSITIHYPPGVG